MLEGVPVPERVSILRDQTLSRAVAVLNRMIPEAAAQVIALADDEFCRRLLEEHDSVRAAILLSRLDEEEREARLAMLPSSRSNEIRTLMSFPPDSAAFLMDPRVTVFRPTNTAKEVLSRLRTDRRGRTHDILLVDEEGRLVGSLPLQNVAVALPADRLENLDPHPPVSIRAMALREEAVEEFAQRNLHSLPVVDMEDRLLGVIRHDALVAATQAEVSADIQTMVGASADERALSNVNFAVRKRLPWLQINLATAFLAAAVVGIFEETIAQFTALAVLLPVVAGQSGNTGAQALAVTMRGLALREIRVQQWLRMLMKETSVAFLNGIAVALTTSLGVYVWSRSFGLALVIGSAMIISMVAAGLSGALIPMALTAVGQDPAQSSSIILTTVTDVVGFLSFLGIATLLSSML